MDWSKESIQMKNMKIMKNQICKVIKQGLIVRINVNENNENNENDEK